MTTPLPSQDTDRDLVLSLVLDAPREKVYQCWTQPELLKQWFAPKPWSTPKAEMDVRAGGRSVITMADDNGNEYPNAGQYLEVVPNQKLVFSDAFTGDWAPSAKPFFTGYHDVRGRRKRQDQIYGRGAALDGRGRGEPQEDGFPRRLGAVRAAVGRAGEADLGGRLSASTVSPRRRPGCLGSCEATDHTPCGCGRYLEMDPGLRRDDTVGGGEKCPAPRSWHAYSPV